MHRLRAERGPDYGSSFADGWLDNFLLNCIGTEMLMGQYLAGAQVQREAAETSRAGVIDTDCDLAQLCRDVAAAVRGRCAERTGYSPRIVTRVYAGGGEPPRICHVPGFLRKILAEVLENSCRATVETAKSRRDLKARPVTIVLCADARHVAVRISDRAQGIPFEVGPKVWSYLYTTRDRGKGPYGERATALAGYGVGLPISRLYAKYLGGSLDLVSMPGYGTSVHLFLSRQCRETRELVPDEDGLER